VDRTAAPTASGVEAIKERGTFGQAAPGTKTINDEVLLLLRLCGEQGDLIRAKLRRKNMYPALVVGLNRGLRDKVVRRWHDDRHTLVTELAESGADDEVIMSIAGHVSRAMLPRYSHVRMEAKRRALDKIAARQRAADEKCKAEAERQQVAAVTSQSAVLQ
jgi:hypothetical protein